MACPLFVDSTRECRKDIESVPANTFSYCMTQMHQDCPFFLILKGDGKICENVRRCAFFRSYTFGEFSEFVRIANDFCTNEKHTECARYKLKAGGREVPADLHPAGGQSKII
jgi:hypothetical protein